MARSSPKCNSRLKSREVNKYRRKSSKISSQSSPLPKFLRRPTTFHSPEYLKARGQRLKEREIENRRSLIESLHSNARQPQQSPPHRRNLRSLQTVPQSQVLDYKTGDLEVELVDKERLYQREPSQLAHIFLQSQPKIDSAVAILKELSALSLLRGNQAGDLKVKLDDFDDIYD